MEPQQGQTLLLLLRAAGGGHTGLHTRPPGPPVETEGDESLGAVSSSLPRSGHMTRGASSEEFRDVSGPEWAPVQKSYSMSEKPKQCMQTLFTRVKYTQTRSGSGRRSCRLEQERSGACLAGVSRPQSCRAPTTSGCSHHRRC